MKKIETGRVLRLLSVVLALCIPGVVVAQFMTGETLTSAKLNRTVMDSCQIVIRTGVDCGTLTCVAPCPSGHVVTGGGCRTNSTANGIRTNTPSFTSGMFPSTGSSVSSLANNPRWDQWACESDAGGTVQTAYAICCPLTVP